ncbi:MAG: SOS response-associated peptidase [Tissierellia bacterium]|jgi:putative SOS response-associated peptidase YedK|nr:SOS response-associated peptidase [Tissierellia bacterium]
MCVHYFAPTPEMILEIDKGRFSFQKPYKDIFPGIKAPIYIKEEGKLQATELIWGYPVNWKKGPVFNTRLESALEGNRMWKDSFESRRCLLPTLGFYEPHETLEVPSPRTGKPIKQQYLFDRQGALFYMAGIYEGGYFSLLTTPPSRYVKEIHSRMPLVLNHDEIALWLSGEGEYFLSRENVSLNVTSRYPQPLEF